MWYFLNLPLASLGCGLLERDSSHIAQSLISRPIWIGVFLGLWSGQLTTGLWLGALFELLYLDVFPIGVAVPSNATIAASVGILCALSPHSLPQSLATLYGLLAGRLYQFLEIWMRGRASRFNALLEATPVREISGKIRLLILSWNARYVALAAGFIYLATLAGCSLLNILWQEISLSLRRALDFWFQILPYITLACAFHLFRWNR